MFEKKVNMEDFNNIDMGTFEEKYSEKGLWEKIQGNVAAIGANLVYKALQLFYVAQSPQCPTKVKAAIYGALGYLISPLDLIPDFTPVAGYADDAVALGTALLLAQMYITDEIKMKAREKIRSLFGEEILRKLEEEGYNRETNLASGDAHDFRVFCRVLRRAANGDPDQGDRHRGDRYARF